MSSNAEIKEKLLFVCNKIDEVLRQNHEAKTKEIPIKIPEETFIQDNNSPNYFTKINSLKSQMEQIQKNLEEIYNIDKVNQLESEIKEKEQILKTLKNENKLLNHAVKEQNKGINEYITKFDSTKDIQDLTEQLKKVKEENHSYKTIFKEINNKIKLQSTNIDKLENKCKKIKQNIEFQKKKQMKEVQKNLQEEKEDKEEDDFDGNIEKMEEAEKNLINEINIEEKNFRIEINEEMQIIKNINLEMKRKNSKIKKLRNEKKLDEINKKNKKRTKSTNKINIKTTSNKDIQNQRRHSNYKQKQSPKLGINYKNNGKSNNTEKRSNLHTPNLIMKNSEKLTKPFEIKKFNAIIKNNDKDEKNNTMFNIYNDNKKMKLTSFGDNLNNDIKSVMIDKRIKKNKNGISALKEIENLKSEIQNALKNNIVILNDIDEIKANYYKKEKDEEMFSAYQTGRFGNKPGCEGKKEENESENNINDKKNNVNYKIKNFIQKEQRTQDYQLKQNDNINEDNSKRKPFDKIIFK
jgi:chromosome segregation protein